MAISISRYLVPYTITRSKIPHYVKVWASSELVAIDASKREIRKYLGNHLGFAIYPQGIVAY